MIIGNSFRILTDRKMLYQSQVWEYCMAKNFPGTKFSRFSRICFTLQKFWSQKFYSQCKPYPFPSKPFESLASVCAMAMYHFFCSMEKLPKLPYPTVFLPTKVPSFSIVLANLSVKSVLKSLLAKGKGLCQAVAWCWWRFIISGFRWHGCSSPTVAFHKSGIHAQSLKR